MTGRSGDAVELMTESFRLAREIKDGQLLARCYNNVPSTMWTNGALIDEVRPIFIEGIDRNRRFGDNGSLSWAAQSLADCLWEIGLIDEAIPFHEQARAAAAAIGDEVKVAIQDLTLAWMDYQRGIDPEDAIARVEAAHTILRTVQETQAEIYEYLWTDGLLWPKDPFAALAELRRGVEQAVSETGRLEGGRLLARMALRLRDDGARALATSSVKAAAQFATGPRRKLDIRWMDAIDRDEAASGAELAAVGAALEAATAPLPAADAYADAALIAGRLGLVVADEYLGHARRLYARCGVHPTLGELPETRWLGAVAPAAVAAD